MNRISQLLFLLAFIIPGIRGAGQCYDTYQTLIRLSDGSPVYVTDAGYSPLNEVVLSGHSNNRLVVAKFTNPQVSHWARYYNAGLLVSKKMVAMSNGNIGIAAKITSPGNEAVLIMRLNSDGQVAWSKRFKDISIAIPGFNLIGFDVKGITETPDNGLVVCGSKSYQQGLNFYDRMFVFKVNAAGDVEWSRQDTQGFSETVSAILLDGGNIVLVGSTYADVRYAFLQKLNAISGELVSFTRYKLDIFPSNYFRSIELMPGGGYEIGTQAFGYEKQLYYRLRLTSGGDPMNLKLFPLIGPEDEPEQFYHPYPMADGSSILTREDFASSPDVELGRVAAADTIAWNNVYQQPEIQQVIKVLPTAGNGVLVIGQSPSPLYPGPMMIHMLQVSADGSIEDCPSQVSPITIKDSLSYTRSTATLSSVPMDFEAPYDYTIAVDDIVPMQPVRMCEACQPEGLRIEGERIICDPAAVETYVAAVNDACLIQAEWTLNPAIGTVQVVNHNTVLINYTQPGTATLTATITTHCTSHSADIQVAYSPVADDIELGSDITLCKNESTVLSVSNIFTVVEWSTGHTTNSITVNQPGLYKVRASTDGVCFVEDSVEVEVNPLPELKLPKDSIICRPDTKTLTAPPGMLSYLWQNNSTQPSLTINNVGTYWVRITDFNHCVASDTVKITKLAERPTDFASFSDTAICTGERLNLSVKQQFAKYDWNNGQSNAPVLQVNRPGIYTINVISKDGCEGEDEILVRDKECKEAIYVPTGFTPNNNGTNDVFKVTCFAFLDFFDLRVFNRWGEMVFQTNDVYTGWNGTFKGVLQPSDAYVWMIRYRFAGRDKEEIQKGTVTLIK